MPISAATLELLINAGLEGEALLEVVRSVEADTVKKRSGAAERQARYRARQKGDAVTSDVTRDATSNATSDGNASRVEDNIYKPNLVDTSRKTIPPNPPLPSKPEPDGFLEFWEIYPKRDGSTDRKGALKAFGPALKRASLQTILDGAQHFAEAMTARGKVGTEFVPQARTWLNGDRWNERYDAVSSPDNRQAQNLAILEKYRAAPRP